MYDGSRRSRTPKIALHRCQTGISAPCSKRLQRQGPLEHSTQEAEDPAGASGEMQNKLHLYDKMEDNSNLFHTVSEWVAESILKEVVNPDTMAEVDSQPM